MDYQDISGRLSEINNTEIDALSKKIENQLATIQRIVSDGTIKVDSELINNIIQQNNEIMNEVTAEKENVIKSIKAMDNAKRYE